MEYKRKDVFTKPATPADILKLALEKEKSSYDFYSQQIKLTKNPSMKKLFIKLKAAEQLHIRYIRKMLER
ncbi:MAG: hypothetical protein KJ977_01230 [Candidatus Omnitrophica bacterium]|nr:hypothetical protein [Candidatus Omnitrophota bacterium]MBU2265640.1 hypothetical protein [Candidatus Omnitrophota bacterium]